MAANSMNPDQTVPKAAVLTFVHIVCNIDYQSTSADEEAGNICHKWRQKGHNLNERIGQQCPMHPKIRHLFFKPNNGNIFLILHEIMIHYAPGSIHKMCFF